jgi:tetratricopeptide (TPR) repeat protein
LRLVDRALELDPRFLEARLQKAQMLFQSKRFDAAEAVLDEAYALHGEPPRLDAQYARLVEIRAGDLEAAEARLRRALEHDPFLVAGYRLLGEVLVRSGRIEEGLEVYRQGLEREPDDAEIHARLGLLLAERGGGAEAERHLGEAIRLGPEFRADLHVARGAWLAEHGRFEEAEAEYRRVLKEDPRHPDARNNHAIALYRTGKADEAIRVLEDLVAEFPRHADSHNNLAAIAVDRRDWPAAEKHARQALAIVPGLTEAWNNLGVGLDEQGRRGDAEAAYRRALERNDGYWPARFNLGVLLRKSGRPEDAVVELERVLAAVPKHPDVHFELGALYAGPLADGERARAHLNAMLRAAPGHPRAGEARRLLSGL